MKINYGNILSSESIEGDPKNEKYQKEQLLTDKTMY